MDIRTCHNEDRKQLKEETQQLRIKHRKERINKLIKENRIKHAHQVGQLNQPEQMDQEVPEEIKEETTDSRHLFLAKHHKKPKRKSNKRCWYCKDQTTLKELALTLGVFTAENLDI